MARIKSVRKYNRRRERGKTKRKTYQKKNVKRRRSKKTYRKKTYRRNTYRKKTYRRKKHPIGGNKQKKRTMNIHGGSTDPISFEEATKILTKCMTHPTGTDCTVGVSVSESDNVEKELIDTEREYLKGLQELISLLPHQYQSLDVIKKLNEIINKNNGFFSGVLSFTGLQNSEELRKLIIGILSNNEGGFTELLQTHIDYVNLYLTFQESLQPRKDEKGVPLPEGGKEYPWNSNAEITPDNAAKVEKILMSPAERVGQYRMLFERIWDGLTNDQEKKVIGNAYVIITEKNTSGLSTTPIYTEKYGEVKGWLDKVPGGIAVAEEEKGSQLSSPSSVDVIPSQTVSTAAGAAVIDVTPSPWKDLISSPEVRDKIYVAEHEYKPDKPGHGVEMNKGDIIIESADGNNDWLFGYQMTGAKGNNAYPKARLKKGNLYVADKDYNPQDTTGNYVALKAGDMVIVANDDNPDWLEGVALNHLGKLNKFPRETMKLHKEGGAATAPAPAPAAARRSGGDMSSFLRIITRDPNAFVHFGNEDSSRSRFEKQTERKYKAIIKQFVKVQMAFTLRAKYIREKELSRKLNKLKDTMADPKYSPDDIERFLMELGIDRNGNNELDFTELMSWLISDAGYKKLMIPFPKNEDKNLLPFILLTLTAYYHMSLYLEFMKIIQQKRDELRSFITENIRRKTQRLMENASFNTVRQATRRSKPNASMLNRWNPAEKKLWKEITAAGGFEAVLKRNYLMNDERTQLSTLLLGEVRSPALTDTVILDRINITYLMYQLYNANEIACLRFILCFIRNDSMFLDDLGHNFRVVLKKMGKNNVHTMKSDMDFITENVRKGESLGKDWETGNLHMVAELLEAAPVGPFPAMLHFTSSSPEMVEGILEAAVAAEKGDKKEGGAAAVAPPSHAAPVTAAPVTAAPVTSASSKEVGQHVVGQQVKGKKKMGGIISDSVYRAIYTYLTYFYKGGETDTTLEIQKLANNIKATTNIKLKNKLMASHAEYSKKWKKEQGSDLARGRKTLISCLLAILMYVNLYSLQNNTTHEEVQGEMNKISPGTHGKVAPESDHRHGITEEATKMSAQVWVAILNFRKKFINLLEANVFKDEKMAIVDPTLVSTEAAAPAAALAPTAAAAAPDPAILNFRKKFINLLEANVFKDEKMAIVDPTLVSTEAAAPDPDPAATHTVLYDFIAQPGTTNIDLTVGEEIVVTDRTRSDWWIGHPAHDSPDTLGTFPAQYVKPV